MNDHDHKILKKKDLPFGVSLEKKEERENEGGISDGMDEREESGGARDKSGWAIRAMWHLQVARLLPFGLQPTTNPMERIPSGWYVRWNEM